MPTMLINLKQRFVAEWPFWHLNLWQLMLLVTWAAWPWLVKAILPGHEIQPWLPAVGQSGLLTLIEKMNQEETFEGAYMAQPASSSH